MNRKEQKGFCGAGTGIVCAKSMLHPWEEPGLTPAGAVFFSGCTLKCLYCQNYRISHEGFGKELTPVELSRVFLRLQEQGAETLDLVTPTHFLPGILEALNLCKKELTIPVVYNCGGYERKEIIRELYDHVDLWLPDVKYFSDEPAVKYSQAPHYFDTTLEAVKEMIRQGKRKNSDPLAKPVKTAERVIIRHMVLPGQKEDSILLLKKLKEELGTGGYLLSLMSQYTPFYKACEHKEINRRVTTYEYEKVLEEAVKLGFPGFMQERTSAREEYTPAFDLEGLTDETT